MTASELVYTILGATRIKTKCLICAIERTVELLFVDGKLMEDIRLVRDIYLPIAATLNMNVQTITRQTIRLTNRCWDLMSEQMKILYVGKALDYVSPGDLLFYFAYYIQYEKSYYEVIIKEGVKKRGR